MAPIEINVFFAELLFSIVLLHMCYLRVKPIADSSLESPDWKFQLVHTSLYFVLALGVSDVIELFVFGKYSLLLTALSLLAWLTLTIVVVSVTVQSSLLRLITITFAVAVPLEILAWLFLENSIADQLAGRSLFTSEAASIDALTLIKGVYAFVMVYAILSYYTNRHLQKQRILHVENPASEGFDSDSLYKLAWLFPAGVATIAALAIAGADLPSLTIATGLIAGAIGLATKDVITNLAAGYFLMWSETIQRSDVISFEDGTYGEVTKITARNTIIRTRDRVNLIIPNNILLSEKIENWTHSQKETRIKLDLWVGYGSDLSLVERLMVRAARNSGERVLRDPGPKALVVASDDSGVRMQMRFFIDDPQNGVKNVSSVVYKEMFKELANADIEIPFPKLDVAITSSETKSEDQKVIAVSKSVRERIERLKLRNH